MNIALANVRCSFPALFTPKAMDAKSKPKYSITVLLDKKQHAKEIAQIKAAIQAVAEEFWGKGKIPKFKGELLRDGTDKVLPGDPANPTYMDGYGPGVMFLAATQDPEKGRPAVVDKDNATLDATAGKPYAGCYVDVTFRLWPQDNQYGKRVNAQLRAVRFRKDGKPFGQGPVDANTEFKDLPPVADEESAGSSLD